MKPNLTESFLNYFLKKDLKNKTLLEIGSGNSFLFWKKIFKTVYAYEDSKEYFIKGMFQLDKHYENNKFLKKHIEDSDYAIIDNNPNNGITRYDFVCFLLKQINKDIIIILDNSNWHMKAYNLLTSIYFNKDFPGLNKNKELTVTSLFETKKDTYHFAKGTD